MYDVFFLYNGCCIYEIVTLNYFLNYTNANVIFCSQDGKSVRTMEGYTINADRTPEDIDETEIRSFVLTGGNVSNVKEETLFPLLQRLNLNKLTLIASICAGTDLLDSAGILENTKSTHSEKEDLIKDGKVITARANAYIDFAIEVAKELNLFTDERDLEETIEFWKNGKGI